MLLSARRSLTVLARPQDRPPDRPPNLGSSPALPSGTSSAALLHAHLLSAADAVSSPSVQISDAPAQLLLVLLARTPCPICTHSPFHVLRFPSVDDCLCDRPRSLSVELQLKILRHANEGIGQDRSIWHRPKTDVIAMGMLVSRLWRVRTPWPEWLSHSRLDPHRLF